MKAGENSYPAGSSEYTGLLAADIGAGSSISMSNLSGYGENYTICFSGMSQRTPNLFRGCFRYLQACLKERTVPTCPLCPRNTYAMSENEIKHVIGRKYLNTFHDIGIQSYLSNASDVYPCPTRNCQEWFVLDDYNRSSLSRLKRVGVPCPSCKIVSCSLCRMQIHYNLGCEEALVATETWLEWISAGRADFWEKARLGDLRESEEHGGNNQRLADLRSDESWKQKNLRLCPHCGRAVEHTGGLRADVVGPRFLRRQPTGGVPKEIQLEPGQAIHSFEHPRPAKTAPPVVFRRGGRAGNGQAASGSADG